MTEIPGVKRIHIVIPKDLYYKLRDGGFLEIVDDMATQGLYKEIERKEELMNKLVLNKCGNSNTHKKENKRNERRGD